MSMGDRWQSDPQYLQCARRAEARSEKRPGEGDAVTAIQGCIHGKKGACLPAVALEIRRHQKERASGAILDGQHPHLRRRLAGALGKGACKIGLDEAG